MILPRYSLRTWFIWIALCGGFFVVLAAAARGEVWAIAITIAAGSVQLAFMIYALFFAAAYIISVFQRGFRRQAPAMRSPFAQHVAAPQLVVPEEDE